MMREHMLHAHALDAKYLAVCVILQSRILRVSYYVCLPFGEVDCVDAVTIQFPSPDVSHCTSLQKNISA